MPSFAVSCYLSLIFNIKCKAVSFLSALKNHAVIKELKPRSLYFHKMVTNYRKLSHLKTCFIKCCLLPHSVNSKNSECQKLASKT